MTRQLEPTQIMEAPPTTEKSWLDDNYIYGRVCTYLGGLILGVGLSVSFLAHDASKTDPAEGHAANSDLLSLFTILGGVGAAAGIGLIATGAVKENQAEAELPEASGVVRLVNDGKSATKISAGSVDITVIRNWE